MAKLFGENRAAAGARIEIGAWRELGQVFKGVQRAWQGSLARIAHGGYDLGSSPVRTRGRGWL